MVAIVAEPLDPINAENARLVADHLAGDERAFGRLVARYHERLVTFLDRIVNDRARAEDLAQEAFLRVHRHLPRFDATRKFSTWLYAIAGNLARNELRSRARSRLRIEASFGLPHDGPPAVLVAEDPASRPDVLYGRRALRDLVDATVARLPASHRAVFVLRELEGKRYEDIAAATDATLGTVKSRLNRARNAFARMIAPHLE